MSQPSTWRGDGRVHLRSSRERVCQPTALLFGHWRERFYSLLLRTGCMHAQHVGHSSSIYTLTFPLILADHFGKTKVFVGDPSSSRAGYPCQCLIIGGLGKIAGRRAPTTLRIVKWTNIELFWYPALL